MFNFRNKNKHRNSSQESFFDSDLIINLNRGSSSESDNKKRKKKSGFSFSALVRIPAGWLRFFRDKEEKGVEFIQRLEELEADKKERKGKNKKQKSTVKKVFLIIFKVPGVIWSAIKLIGKVFKLGVFITKLRPWRIFKKENHKKKPQRKRFLKKKREKKHHSSDSGSATRSFFRSLLSFFLLLFLIILPFKFLDYYTSFDLDQFKNRIVGSSERALGDFENAAQALTRMDVQGANKDFSQANANFVKAQKQIQQINGLVLELSRFAPQKEIQMASVSDHVLSAGRSASQLGENLTSAFDTLLKLKNKDKKKDTIKIVNDFEKQLEQAIANAEKLNKEVKQIDGEVLPEKYKTRFLKLKDKSQALKKGLEELALLTEKSKIFLGAEYDKKYLLVFQNSNEIRASGGFAGSFAMMEFSRGNIENIEVPQGGSYDLDGGMSELIAAPKPLQLVTSRWYFRDANWWPDWPSSARNLMSFYEKSGGPTVDGCISFTPEALGRILEITGPLDMREKYDIIITKDNYWEAIRGNIEEEKKDNDNDHKPKKIINDLTHRIIQEFSQDLNQEKMVELLSAVQESLDSKNIQFYFEDQELQQEVIDRSWGGRIKDTQKDYFLLVNSNIAGKKSNKKIEQEIHHRARIKPDGSVVDQVKISRSHTATSGDPLYYLTRNVNWMRVYVPRGSELLEARGFKRPQEKFFEEPGEDWKTHPKLRERYQDTRYHRESGTRIYSEQNKTVFANWTILDPGETNVIYLEYKLPFKLKDKKRPPQNWWQKWGEIIASPSEKEKKERVSYSLLAQKQAGSDADEISSSLVLPSDWRPIWKYPKKIDFSDQGWNISQELNSDKYWATVLEKQ